MKLSVAMCTCNGELYLSEQLESLAAQTRRPDELVICDDRSTDSTVEIIEAFAASRAPFPVRLHVNDINLGVGKNFEHAVGLCMGDIVALADQDDVWSPQKLQLIEEQFSSPAVGVVFSDAEIVNSRLEPSGHTMWEYTFPQEHRRLFSAGKSFEVLLAGCTVTGATMAFRTRFKELAFPMPPIDSMIYDGWIALMVASVSEIAFVDHALIKYRQHERQQMGFRPQKKVGLLDTVRIARRTHGDAYLPSLNKFKAIRERLSLYRDELRRPELLATMDELIAHRSLRAELPSKSSRRAPLVCRELFARRYHRHSRGLGSALKDLWIGGRTAGCA